MAELIRERVIVRASPEAVWAILGDADALQRVLPGAESIVAMGPDAFHGVIASRIQFMTVRADVDASYHDARPPRHLRLQLQGRPHGLPG